MTTQPDETKDNLTIYSFILTIVGWVILAIVFGLFDLQISILLTNPYNTFGNILGQFGAELGEVPGWVLIAIAGTVLGGSFNPKVKWQKIAAPIAVVICILVAVIALLLGENEYFLYGICMAVGVAVFTVITWNKDWSKYRKIALIIILLAVINSLLFVQATKILTGRIRFRNLLPPNYDGFTHWFLPPGFSLDNWSFPSGHAAMGWMLLPLLILIKNEKKSIRIPITAIILGWGVFVGLSRVLAGAHFASDVLFSSGSAIVITFILYKIMYRKQGK